MGFKINAVKADLCSYPPFMFLAPKKFGKTTFWYNLVREAWGSNKKGLLVSFGNEEGYHALDGLQYEVARKWTQTYDEKTDTRGFVQIVDDIVKNNHTYGLKGICIDTLDTFIDVATQEVYRQHKIEKKAECKSLNDAFGGYGRGKVRLLDICNEQIDRLRQAGLMVFICCHTKNKEKTDMLSGEKYEQLSNNLTDDIFSNFANEAQMTMVGAFDRKIEDGKIINEERKIFLRGSSTIDAGTRFTSVPESIELSPQAFLNAFEEAVKASMSKEVTKDEIQKMKKSEEKVLKQTAKLAREKENETPEEDLRMMLLDTIQEKFSTLSTQMKTIVKNHLNNAGYSKFNEPEIPIDVLKEIVDIINKSE